MVIVMHGRTDRVNTCLLAINESAVQMDWINSITKSMLFCNNRKKYNTAFFI